MKLHLKEATLIQRYKRFLADITLQGNIQTTIHCANTGAMTGCATPNDTVYYSESDNPKRKYPFSWEITKTAQDHFICVNTIRANQLVEEALNNQKINEFIDFKTLKREVKYGSENSKIDFLLTESNGKSVYIEVKSVTLLDNKQGYFPDAITTRGQKHLRELIEVVAQGHRAVLFFAILHSGIDSVKAARHIDPKYADLIIEANNSGVEIIAYQAEFTHNEELFEVSLKSPIDVIID